MTLIAPGSTLWLLAHEMRLYWRNFRAGRAGRRARGMVSLLVIGAMLLGGGVLAALGLHGIDVPINPVSISIAALATLAVFTLMLSQTLSASSEALYERNDLDLLFSSPIGPAKVLFVRSLGVAGGVITIFLLAEGTLDALRTRAGEGRGESSLEDVFLQLTASGAPA